MIYSVVHDSLHSRARGQELVDRPIYFCWPFGEGEVAGIFDSQVLRTRNRRVDLLLVFRLRGGVVDPLDQQQRRFERMDAVANIELIDDDEVTVLR